MKKGFMNQYHERTFEKAIVKLDKNNNIVDFSVDQFKMILAVCLFYNLRLRFFIDTVEMRPSLLKCDREDDIITQKGV